MAFRRFRSSVLFGLALLGPGGCEQKPVSAPPTDVAPRGAGPAQPDPLGDTSAAYGGHDEAGSLQSAEPRTRPEPAKLESREAAIEAVTHGNPEGGRDFLSGFVTEHPTDIDALHALARAHLLLGDTAATRAALHAQIGKDTTATRLAAESLAREGQLEQAAAMLRDAAKKNAGSMALRGDLVTIEVARGKRDDAAVKSLMDGLYDDYEADRAKTEGDLFAVAQAALGRGTKGALKDANMVFGEAEELAGANAPAGWDLEAIVLRRADMFREKYAAEDALQTYALILEGRDAWHPDALAGSARVHVDNLAFAVATRLAQEALLVDPTHPDAHAVLARIALIEGRRDEAHSRIEEHVLARNPSHTSGLAVMAALSIVKGDDAGYTRWRDAALAVNPHNGLYYKELADVLGFLHLYPETDVILIDGLTRAPKDPAVLAARALNLLRLGKEKVARELLEQAWSRDPFNERTRNTLDLYDERIDKLYGERKVGDLVLRLPSDERDLIEPVLVESTRTSRDALDAAYHTQAGELRLEFFSDPSDFSIRTVGVPSLGAVAVCFGPVITFIGPYAGRFNIDNVIRHELGHVYAIRLSKGRVPRWFTEGLSEWESEQADPAFARESAQLLVSARRAGKLRKLSELELAFIRAESPQMMEVAYATAAYSIRYLGSTYGRDKLIAMLKGYAAGKHTEELMKTHLGKPLSQVEDEFEAWFFAQLDGVFSGWQPAADPSKGDERDALFQRALASAQEGDRDAARAALEELIGRDGDGFAPRMMLVRLADPSAPSTQTRKHLEAARAFHRESVEPLVMLANLARKEDRPDDEKRHLEAALAIDGDGFEPAGRLLMLGVVTADRTATKLALRRARAIAPLHPIALAGQALALKAKGNTKRATALARAAAKRLEGAEGPADTFVIVALAAADTGDAATARVMAKRALELGGLPKAAKTRIETLAQ
ncbi:MAG: peptidase MA family metallohydrolase [Nannocystales bacterium]